MTLSSSKNGSTQRVDLLHVLTLAGLLVLSAAAFFIARDFGDGTPSGGNVFLILLPIIGYPLLAPLWLCAVMRVFGMRSPLVLGLVSIGLSALAWTLLSRLAYAPPPAGLFEHFL